MRAPGLNWPHHDPACAADLPHYWTGTIQKRTIAWPQAKDGSALDRVHEIGPTGLTHFRLHGPAVAEAVTQFEHVELLGECDAVAHVKSRREVSAQNERSLVGEIGLEADVFDPDAGTELLGKNGASLRQQLAAGTGLARLGGLERAASEDEGDDLRLGQGWIGEETHARLQQRAADVDARGYVGKLLDRTNIDAGIADRAAGEDQPPALDIELARIGGVLALFDGQLARGARDWLIATAHSDVAREAARQAGRVDADMITQSQRDGARHLEALRWIRLLLTDDHFVIGRADGSGEILRDDLGVGDVDRSGHVDLATIDAELQFGRGIDMRLRNVDYPQVSAFELHLAVREGVAPFEAALGLGDSR